MKRILAILLLASMMLVMASCGASNPNKTVEKYVEAMLDGDLKKASKYTAVDYEDIFDAMIAQMMEEGEISKKEALENFSESLDTKIKNFNDYSKYIKKMTEESLKEEYEGKIKIEAYVVATEILEEDAKYSALKAASNQYDSAKVILSEEINVAKVKECRKVTVKAYLYEDGSDIFSSVETLDVIVIKLGSKWVILNSEMGLG